MNDTIHRKDAIEALLNTEHTMFDTDGYIWVNRNEMRLRIEGLPSTESVKKYTKADYIMALHKEYGCTLTRAEEAHNKALEYLRSKSRMKG